MSVEQQRVERALLALDDLFFDELKDAARVVWVKKSAGEPLAEDVAEYLVAVGNIVEIHDALRAATAAKLGAK
jgi:hypothetical protein